MAKKKFARECNACGKGMNEGYCIEGGIEYYCSDACLHTEITLEEYMELYADGEGDSYWTDWSEDPEHFEDDEGVEIKLDIEDIDEPLYDALLAAFRAEAARRGLTIDAHIFEDWRVVCRAHMNNEEDKT
jgi:hypothetical protein